ncbi:MAG: putative nucleic acid-binding Zn-ribbon protein, partial [Candidatus Azotimanducaceae bacterium]
MAKRRIVLTSQEMNDLSGKIKLLESQLSRSNNRVSELESDVRKIQKLVEKKSKRKNPDLLCDEVIQLTSRAINPPVTVREERLALELAQELALA